MWKQFQEIRRDVNQIQSTSGAAERRETAENKWLTMEEFKLLAERGVINFFERCEITQIYLHRKIDKVNINLLILAILEERPYDGENFKYLTDKPITVDDEFSLCVHRYFVSISEAESLFKNLSEKKNWLFRSDTTLVLGELQQIPKQFVPPSEKPLNKVLKNNFDNGSYILEFFDVSKNHVQFLMAQSSIKKFNQIAEEIKAVVPVDLSLVRDRVGNIIFQFPIRILDISSKALSNWTGIEVRFSWNNLLLEPPNCYIEVSSTFDENIMGATLVDYNKTRKQEIVIENLDQISHVKVWLKSPNLLLHSHDGTFIRELALNMGIVNHEPRIFEVNGKSFEVQIVNRERSVRNKRKIGYTKFVQSRIYTIEKEDLEKNLSFKQYGNGRVQNQTDAILDLQNLVKRFGGNGAYLWDPFLQPKDIHSTLYFNDVSMVPLKAIGSINKTVKQVYNLNGMNIGDIIATYQGSFKNPANNNFGLNLEFRIQYEDFGWAFHDRFLMFPSSSDDGPKAFSLGASVNSFGADHHILQEVSHPQRIIDAFEDLWSSLDRPECLVWKSIP